MPSPSAARTLTALLAGMLVLGRANAHAEAQLKARSQIVEDLYDTHFADAKKGWAVGVFGSVYVTTDGGAHWTAQTTPTTQHLYGVAFVDPSTGWAVGREGEIIHTSDGGAHWTKQQSGTQKHLFKVVFTSPTVGWAVGDWGVVVRTADGGEHWEDRSLQEDKILYALDFADLAHGWMVGEFGTILRTEDGGQTWTKQDPGTEKTLFGIAAASPDRAWAVGIDGLVVRTVDGGAHWQLQKGQAEMASFENIGFLELLRNPGLYDVKMSGRTGYIVGDTGNVLATDDGGETWTNLLLPPEWRLSWIRGLALLPSGGAMLVGASGLTFTAEGKEMHFSQQLSPAS